MAQIMRRPRNPLDQPAVGMNLAKVSYFATAHPLRDLVKVSKWETGGGYAWNVTGSPNPTLDADGYPTDLSAQTLKTWMNLSIDGRYPSGTYVLESTGAGTVTAGLDAVDAGGGNYTVTASSSGLKLELTGGAVSDIKFYKNDENPANGRFRDDFLDSLRPYSCIRFMNWSEINDSTKTDWADRSTTTQRTWHRIGVPYEVQCELANELQINPWFCIPHLATDDFCNQLGTLIAANLDTSLEPLIEWSNEVWNTAFTQGTWLNSEATSRGIGREEVHQIESDRTRAAFLATWPTSRKCYWVVSGQFRNPTYLTNVLSYSPNLDALGIAPYFDDRTGASTDPIATISANISTDITGELTDDLDSHKALADAEGVPLICYEAGQHLVGGDNYGVIQTDDLIRDRYKQWFELWKAKGGKLACMFLNIQKDTTTSGGNYWGHRQYYDETRAMLPKLDAVLDYAAKWEVNV